MKTKSVRFPCGKLELEGCCYYPDGGGKFPGVVLCHPHPLYGGSMNNNVVQTLASDLVKKSIVALMFNFRGVGRSQGEFDNGNAEQEDVSAALDWLEAQPELDKSKLGVAGYSFGASVALPEACHDPRVRALALISPALMDQAKIAQLKDCQIPKLIVSGDADDFVSEEQLKLMQKEAADSTQIEIVPGVDHFWISHEAELADKVANFLSGLFT
jgi:alpha/beta superfamily hydrolase